MNLMDFYTRGNGPFGYSPPGSAAPAVTSPQTKARMANSLGSAVASNAAKTFASTVVNLSAGMPSSYVGQSLASGMAGPSAIAGMLSAPINAAFGIDNGIAGKLAKMALTTGFTALGGPVMGLMSGLLGDVAIDGVMDAIDMRSREEVRDDYEGQAGYFGGRMAYADRLGLEQKAARVRDALPSSMAAISAMDKAIAATRALERHYGINPSYGANPGPSRSFGSTYGGWGSVGGPSGGARAVDPGYGPNMGGFAGLGIGNPSSYGGRGGSTGGGRRDRDGDGNSDTAGNAGFGR